MNRGRPPPGPLRARSVSIMEWNELINISVGVRALILSMTCCNILLRLLVNALLIKPTQWTDRPTVLSLKKLNRRRQCSTPSGGLLSMAKNNVGCLGAVRVNTTRRVNAAPL